MIKEKITDLYLPFLDRGERRVRVFVPEHEEGETFPVIYMTDGQNLFEKEFCAFGCWNTREAAAKERAETGRTAVIVGIFSSPDPMGRTNELMPGSIGEPFGNDEMIPSFIPPEIKKTVHPEGELFDDFIINTVMPAVEEQFPVKTGRLNTALCGSSSGGGMSLFTVLNHTDKFGFCGSFSPALMMFSTKDLNNWFAKTLRGDKPFIYLYSGGTEAIEVPICQCTKILSELLEKYCPEGLLKTVIIPENKHNEEAWEKIFADMLHDFLALQNG